LNSEHLLVDAEVAFLLMINCCVSPHSLFLHAAKRRTWVSAAVFLFLESSSGD
jgi:hypothetical protein